MNPIVSAPFLGRTACRFVAALALIALQPALAEDLALSEVDVDPPGRVARLSYVEGAVSLAPSGAEEWTEAVLNRPLTSGDRLWLDEDARAELEVGSTTLHLDRETAFGFVKLDDAVLLASLTEGSASVRVRSLDHQEAIQIETPNATVRIRSAGDYTVHFDPDSDQTILRARSGEAEVLGGSASHLVRENQEGVFTGVDDLRAQIGPIAPRTAFESWAEDRAQREDASVSSRYVSPEVTGYEDLDDHGEWTYVSSYGYVWQPRSLVNNWAPYRFGRWLWIGPWGWTWVDDTSWGFAPFHYGRWVNQRDRWCWVPGPRNLRPVYAPALVGWRGNPPGRYTAVGRDVRWFPLAPHEVYVPGFAHTPRFARRVNQSNTVVDTEKVDRAYTARDRVRDYRNRTNPGALTAGRQTMWEDLRERANAHRDAAPARANPSSRQDAARHDAREAAPSRLHLAERELRERPAVDGANARREASPPRTPALSAPRPALSRPAPSPAAASPRQGSSAAASPRQGSSASASQSSGREAREASPTRSSPARPQDTSRPRSQQR